MSQSLAQILLHVVFSTKHREPIIAETNREALHAYLGGILENLNGVLLKAGSVPDHIHLLVGHPRTCAPADLVQEIKTGSSKWLKTQDSRYAKFHWQTGYGIFSVSPSNRVAVESYLERQAEHHRVTTFQEEYRELLRRHGIKWDERYVWD